VQTDAHGVVGALIVDLTALLVEVDRVDPVEVDELLDVDRLGGGGTNGSSSGGTTFPVCSDLLAADPSMLRSSSWLNDTPLSRRAVYSA
jgi:hypothetical protein